ncbi:E3 ubiquitin-protein ligase TRIM39-like isoform X2 [Trematomus bernacchii]|uniref:E3 ubiquitin-protein ligase TRIM39-like isoform X2 n=1 Tax=Trematomus bernacchii TaxID=40690 RepID=UPI00146E62E7|nr:E3 ubiquitin-protein ligase TRIM39-like isoform X2 [Trematomus bernacchii]
MSSVSCLLSEEQFRCAICLDVFRDPVSTPCGHNFCKTCITAHWDNNNRCPLCNEGFKKRPFLRVNTLFSEMVGEFRQSAQQKANRKRSQQQSFKPVNVPCDFCTGTKLKALKSCLVCLASYCETHLEPHLNVSGLKRHQLIDPVENLEDRMCPKHDKPLELFCKTDQTFVCLHCSALDHKMHEFVPLKYECEDKKVELVKTEAKIQEMIQKRRVKIEAIRHSVKCSTENAHMELSEGVQVFTSLIKFLERGLNELYKTIGEKMTTTQKQAEGLIKELEQEISDLKKRNTDVGQVTRSEDHLHVLRSFPLLKAVPPTKDWTKINVHVSSYEKTVEGALIQLEETLNKEMKKLLGEAELKRVQKYAVDVTLDPYTAHPELILSPDRKQVSLGNVKKNLPDNPERFSHYNFVLGRQSFSSSRFYSEVHVQGKPKWNIGVARESINRKGEFNMRPQDGYWTICLRNGNEYKALDAPSVLLSLKSRPQKVGVFVDYEEGLVSFYDVYTAALIYSFTGCCFNGKIYLILSPCNNDGGNNAAPLIIVRRTVNQTA